MTFLRKMIESLKSAFYGNDLTLTSVTPCKIQYSDLESTKSSAWLQSEYIVIPGNDLLNTQPKVRLSPYWNCKDKHWEGNYFGTVKTIKKVDRNQ